MPWGTETGRLERHVARTLGGTRALMKRHAGRGGKRANIVETRAVTKRYAGMGETRADMGRTCTLMKRRARSLRDARPWVRRARTLAERAHSPRDARLHGGARGHNEMRADMDKARRFMKLRGHGLDARGHWQNVHACGSTFGRTGKRRHVVSMLPVLIGPHHVGHDDHASGCAERT